MVNFVYGTEPEKYVFSSCQVCRWTQKGVSKADEASILLIKCWGQLQGKRMEKIQLFRMIDSTS